MQIINANSNTIVAYFYEGGIVIPRGQKVDFLMTNELVYVNVVVPATSMSHEFEEVGPYSVISVADTYAMLMPAPVPEAHYSQVWWDGVLAGIPISAALLIFLAVRRAFRVGDSCAD